MRLLEAMAREGLGDELLLGAPFEDALHHQIAVPGHACRRRAEMWGDAQAMRRGEARPTATRAGVRVRGMGGGTEKAAH
jgi:hypothetical protein